MNTWSERFQQELSQAETARSAGKEGRARACARRAAGILIAEYYQRQGIPTSGLSAYELIQKLSSQPHLPTSARERAGYFLQRVTLDHTLPVEADLIQEARRLAAELLDQSSDPGSYE